MLSCLVAQRAFQLGAPCSRDPACSAQGEGLAQSLLCSYAALLLKKATWVTKAHREIGLERPHGARGGTGIKNEQCVSGGEASEHETLSLTPDSSCTREMLWSSPTTFPLG